MQRTYAVKEKGEEIMKRKKHLVTGARSTPGSSTAIEKHLVEIIWLLKSVIFGLGLLVFLVFVYVIKH